MDERMAPVLVFSNLPSLNDLVCVVVTLDDKEIKDPSAKSDFQWQLLKTRLLIYNDDQIVASPMMENLAHIYVICSKKYYLQGCLSLTLKRHNLQVEAVSSVSLTVYKNSLLYYIVCKLSPDWNRIENYFIYGKFFLMDKGALDTVELRIHVTDNELQIYCNPTRLWISEFQILDFDVPSSVLKDSMFSKENSQPFFTDLSACPVWAHVLPSFKRGRIVFITNQIPADSPFRNYEEIRRNWKNIYGFRLPNEELGMIYVGVNFFGHKNFLYPLPCVRRGLHQSVGDFSLIKRFAEHILLKSSSFCGVRLNLKSIPQVPDNYCVTKLIAEQNSNWNERDLLQIERRLIYNFINPANGDNSDSCKMVNDDEWFVKCSNFIEGLSQINDKGCRSKKPILFKPVHPIFASRPRRYSGSIIRKPIFIDDSDENIKIEVESEDSSTIDLYNSPQMPKKDSDPKSIYHKPCFTIHKSFLKIREPDISKSEHSIRTVKGYKAVPKQSPHKPLFLDSSSKKHSCSLLIDKTENIAPNKAPKKSWKPIMLSDEEVEECARIGKLRKVNAPSLFLYLKKKGVVCSRKEKKSELILKAEIFFSQSISSLIKAIDGPFSNELGSPKVKVETMEFYY